MREALQLLDDLSSDDVDWFLIAGLEQRVPPGAHVTDEGTRPEALFVVLTGLLGVRVSAMGDTQLAAIGPGEIIGDISFLEGSAATATVTAVEESLLLTVDRARLERQCADDPRFAARLFRSLARIAARRLRERIGAMGQILRDRGADDLLGREFVPLAAMLDGLKRKIEDADREALRAHGEITPVQLQLIRGAFAELVKTMSRELGPTSRLSEAVKDELGARVRREVLPYVLLTQLAERCYAKPRGYAGDYGTLEMMYRNTPAGAGRLGPALDACFLDLPSVHAVRNRRRLIADEILQFIDERGGGETNVLSLACGPAREIFDVFERVRDPERLHASLVDIDPQALEMVRESRDALDLGDSIDLVNANLVYLAIGRQKLDVAPQDFVYSMGLIDYFSDKLVVRLLDFIHGLLAPGGKVLLGNFHPNNPGKEAMDHILDWRLIHRSEAELDAIFVASKFGRPCTRFRFEEQRVDVFAECIR